MSNECLLLVVVHPKAVRGVSANLEHMASRFALMYEPAPREGVSGGEVEDSLRRQ